MATGARENLFGAGRWAAGALAAAAFVAGCGQESGSGDVTGFLTVPGCLSAPEGAWACTGAPADPPEICDSFDLDPHFFTLNSMDGQAVMRLQTSGEDFARGDALALHLADVTAIRGRLGEPLPVGPEEDVRGTLVLFETCPDVNENLELRGTVTFEAFGAAKGDRVAGTLDELLVRDGRTGALRGRLHGRFDFTVRRGPPYRRFVGR